MKVTYKSGEKPKTQNYVNPNIKAGDVVIIKDYSYSEYKDREGYFCNTDPNHGKPAKVISTGNLEYSLFTIDNHLRVIVQMDLLLKLQNGTYTYISSSDVRKEKGHKEIPSKLSSFQKGDLIKRSAKKGDNDSFVKEPIEFLGISQGVVYYKYTGSTKNICTGLYKLILDEWDDLNWELFVTPNFL